MGLGDHRLALYSPLGSAATNPTDPRPLLTQLISATAAWWDASTPSGMAGPGNAPATTWNSAGSALTDLTGNGNDLMPFHNPANATPPVAVPHLSGLSGGAGFPIGTPGLLQPALDPGAGWQPSASTIGAASSWTWYLVWSRPNWRQGTNHDADPITLLAAGSRTILQVDSKGGANRLVLYPGTEQVVLSSSMTRRHTHSIIIRYSPSSGTDVWLDGNSTAQSVPWPAIIPASEVLLLHDGSAFGSAQCWLHEASTWTRALINDDVTAVLSYAQRWIRGDRKGIYLIVNGQSNAINFAMNDGAAALLAQGVAWYLGALAYNVLAMTGGPTSYTMQGGHGLYAVPDSGYPGSFVQDPGTGASPTTWLLGDDGLAVQQAVASLPAADLADMCAIIWPWNETDSLRQYSEFNTFKAAAVRFLSLLRSMLGDTGSRIPLVWWNAIPYGSADGMTMHRQVVQSIASDQSQNVIIGNPQTSDSNPRGSSWDPTTGVATGGDSAHRDSADNKRFAALAAPIVARALAAAGYADSIPTMPSSLPRIGGPTITHVYKQSSTILVITVAHDGGKDLIVPLLAASGRGFAIMDGGTPGDDGAIVPAISCQRLDATHLQVVLAAALQNAPAACQLFYPYGQTSIGRGNAVTDDFSQMPMPTEWDAGYNLGTGWALNCPLSATFSGIPLSSTPA